MASSIIVVVFSIVQNQPEDKSKNDSIKIVSRGHLPPAPTKGTSRAAKMRAVARGDDTASTLKHEQQVGHSFLYYYFFLQMNGFRPFSVTARPSNFKSLFTFVLIFRKKCKRC